MHSCTSIHSDQFCSVPMGQVGPDRGVLFTQHPRAESLKSILADEFVPVLKSAQVGEEDPFAQLVAIEEEIRAMVCGVPLDSSVVGQGELKCIGCADVICRRVWLLTDDPASLDALLYRSTCVPVVPI